MKYEEIIKLLDAGYSREEILSMNEAPEEKHEEKKDEQPAPDMSDVLNEMKEMFNDMRKEFTAFNIMNSRQPAEADKTAEDIIANIISPTKSKKDK